MTVVTSLNATLLARGSRGRGVSAERALPRWMSKVQSLEQRPQRETEKREQMSVGAMVVGDAYSFLLVVRACRDWLGALRWAGEADVRVGSLFPRKAWR